MKSEEDQLIFGFSVGLISSVVN